MANPAAPAYKDRESKPNVHQRLLAVQAAVVAARSTQGKFGPTRSAEQILGEAKPPCVEHGLLITTTDAVEVIEGRRYLLATAVAVNVDEPEQRIEVQARAWEGEVETTKDGRPILDPSQVTGKASSYATKYALQHLLAIGGEADADHDQGEPQTRATRAPRQAQEAAESPPADRDAVDAVKARAERIGASARLRAFVKERYGEGAALTAGQLRTVEAWVTAQEKANGSQGHTGASPSNPPNAAARSEAASRRAVLEAELGELSTDAYAAVMADTKARGWSIDARGWDDEQVGLVLDEIIPAHTPA